VTGAFRSLGGIPIGTTGSIPITIEIVISPDSSIHFFERIPIDSGSFGTEALSVDPKFSTPPDSALRERIDRESRAAVRVYRNAHNSPRRWEGPFRRPLDGRITSPFGKGRLFNGELRSRHSGTDFDGDTGDSVRVVNSGVVALTGSFYYAGNVVYVDHGQGLLTVYMHLSKIEVDVGDVLSTGDLIGLVGATGRVTGPHLHLQAKYGTVTVNALDLFDIDATVFQAPAAQP
jgi:murein DD-endopeptidase MepM/ murein hydrolase activator NlpD